MNDPKVSVCVVTYNQEKYIRQCLQSIVDQKTDFAFEVIVGDDASTDGTRAIIDEFVRRYPSKVRCIRQMTNIGPSKNYVVTHTSACGKYIAHMDGDDYALPGKLQLQVDYLETHQDCAITWHRVLLQDDNTETKRQDFENLGLIPIQGFSQSDLLAIGTVGVHSSSMYRSICRPATYPEDGFLDYYVAVELAAHGFRGVLLHDTLGVYRINVGIASHGYWMRRTYLHHLQEFSVRYPEERCNISSQAIRMFLGDIIRLRPTLALSAAVAFSTFHPLWPVSLLHTHKYHKGFRDRWVIKRQ